jgi:hypothetical protein
MTLKLTTLLVALSLAARSAVAAPECAQSPGKRLSREHSQSTQCGRYGHSNRAKRGQDPTKKTHD